MSEHQITYRIYRRVVNYLKPLCPEPHLGQFLADRALKGADQAQFKIEAHVYGISGALAHVWDDLESLRARAAAIAGGRHHDDPLPDVYAAALSMRIGGDWNFDPTRSLYRGQRSSAWKVVPALYRPEIDGTLPDVERSWRRVDAFVAALRQARPGLSDDECLAVAQHYSAEAGTRTHLIDLTLDPLVALFFASYAGQDGDLGVVDHIVIPEWRSLVARDHGHAGAIRVIDVPGVLRIQSQRARFLETPDPDLYERYLPYRIWFHQKTGLLFEDPAAEPPVTEKALFPLDPDIGRVLDSFDPGATHPPSISVSPPGALPGVTAQDLLSRAMSSEPRLAQLSAYNQAVLRLACAVLASGPEWAGDADTGKYSLHRLDECVRLLVADDASGHDCHLERALQFTLSRLTEDETRALLRLARSVWRQTYELAPRTVAFRLAGLVDAVKDIAAPFMTAGLAFCGPEEHLDLVVSHLNSDSRWALLDLRQATDAQLVSRLATLQDEAVVVLACDQVQPLSPAVRRVVRACLDRRSVVDFGPNGLVRLSPDRVLILVFGGVSAFEIPSEARTLIPYWLDVDEFKPGGW